MTENDLDPSIREWLFAREAMRKLGFSADDLFFACQRDGRVIEKGFPLDLGKPVIMLVLQAQGKKWSWTIGTVEIPVDKVQQAYEDACALWNNSEGKSWIKELWVKSMAYEQKVMLVAELKSKGFEFGDRIIN